VAALNSVVLLAGNIRLPALPGDLDLPLTNLNLHIIAAEPGKLRRDHVILHGFVTSMGGIQPDGLGANRSRRCWIASRSRIGSHRAMAISLNLA
jgi:hypothetical protein